MGGGGSWPVGVGNIGKADRFGERDGAPDGLLGRGIGRGNVRPLLIGGDPNKPPRCD